MRWGISGAPIPAFVPFADELTAACAAYPGGFPPCFLAALKWNESGTTTDPAITSDDGGHGILQLTASFPADWADPRANADYALRWFLGPAVQFFLDRVPGISGDALIKCAAAAYNAGEGGAWSAYQTGDVDRYDTDDYGARAVHNFHALTNGVTP